MRFSEKLRSERERAGLSLRDLAGATGMDFTYISSMESGRVYPASEEKIKKLEAALELKTGTLLELAPKINQKSVQAAVAKSSEAGYVLHAVVNTLTGAEIDELARIIRQGQEK